MSSAKGMSKVKKAMKVIFIIILIIAVLAVLLWFGLKKDMEQYHDSANGTGQLHFRSKKKGVILKQSIWLWAVMK